MGNPKIKPCKIIHALYKLMSVMLGFASSHAAKFKLELFCIHLVPKIKMVVILGQEARIVFFLGSKCQG